MENVIEQVIEPFKDVWITNPNLTIVGVERYASNSISKVSLKSDIIIWINSGSEKKFSSIWILKSD